MRPEGEDSDQAAFDLWNFCGGLIKVRLHLTRYYVVHGRSIFPTGFRANTHRCRHAQQNIDQTPCTRMVYSVFYALRETER